MPEEALTEEEKKENENEELVSIFDPSINAFREVPLSVAKQFIQSAKELEEKLKNEHTRKRKRT